VERFCNAVAAAMLLPAKYLLEEPMVAVHRGTEWSDHELTTLANRYGVSREAVLLRLLTLRQTSETFYWSKRREFVAYYKAHPRPKAKGGPAVHVTAVSRAGGLFTRLVLNSYHQHIITAADVSEYLAVGVPHLPKVEGELHRGGVAA
jgi:Zn-dependent peptidase ImmA (M78 family)